jgi:hypothetical protein
LVKRSSNEAPKGRVKMKATQNMMKTWFTVVKRARWFRVIG